MLLTDLRGFSRIEAVPACAAPISAAFCEGWFIPSRSMTRPGAPACLTGASFFGKKHAPIEKFMDRSYTFREKAKVTAGMLASLVIVGWLIVLALALLSVGVFG